MLISNGNCCCGETTGTGTGTSTGTGTIDTGTGTVDTGTGTVDTGTGTTPSGGPCNGARCYFFWFTPPGAWIAIADPNDPDQNNTTGCYASPLCQCGYSVPFKPGTFHGQIATLPCIP